MKRLWLAAILSASIASVCLCLTPREAAAWWTGDAYLERKVATEGDPDDPDFTLPDFPAIQEEALLSPAEVFVRLVITVVTGAGGI